MAKYCKRAEFVEAVRLESCQCNNPKSTIIAFSEAPPEWIHDAFNDHQIRIMYNESGVHFAVKTIRREEYAYPGDWIVNDQEGLRAVKNDDFLMLYSER